MKALNFNIIFIFIIISTLFISGKIAFSQGGNDSSAAQPEKLTALLYVSYRASDDAKSVKIRLTRKENRKAIPVDNLKSPLNLYLNEVKKYNPSDGTGWIGNLIPGQEGQGIFELSADYNQLISKFHQYTFIVKMNSDPVYEDLEESVTVTDSKIILEYSVKDSVKTATATLIGWKDSAYVPIPDADLKLSIKRTFSLFPVGEEGQVTDEHGRTSAILPADIPGTYDSAITIAAKIEDNETYGTVLVTKTIPWDVLPKPHPDQGRTLWSSANNAPLPLVFSSIAIIITIWGTILYLVTLLIKIRKISRE